jgi:hypothetical protein
MRSEYLAATSSNRIHSLRLQAFGRAILPIFLTRVQPLSAHTWTPTAPEGTPAPVGDARGSNIVGVQEALSMYFDSSKAVRDVSLIFGTLQGPIASVCRVQSMAHACVRASRIGNKIAPCAYPLSHDADRVSHPLHVSGTSGDRSELSFI